MKPKATIATGLILTLLAGPAGAHQSPPAPVPQTPPAASTQAPPSGTPPPEDLQRIRAAINREPSLRIENGQLRIYVEVIGHWPSFTELTQNYDLINGPTGYGNPMSHQEFVNMVTPQDMYSSVGIKPGEIVTMAAVNAIGQWAIGKALNKIATSRKEKQMREIQAQIDADLAAIKKER